MGSGENGLKYGSVGLNVHVCKIKHTVLNGENQDLKYWTMLNWENQQIGYIREFKYGTKNNKNSGCRNVRKYGMGRIN